MKKHYFGILILVFVAIFVFKLAWSVSYVGYYQDDASYILISKALLTGKGYVSLEHPKEPDNRIFLPGYTILLMPFVYIIGENYQQLKWVNTIIMALVLPACYYLFRDKLPIFLIWIMLVLILINPLIILHAASVLSDPLFLLSTCVFFIFISKYQPGYFHNIKTAFLIGLVVTAASSIRIVGFLFLLPIIALGIHHKSLKLIIGGLLPNTILLLLANYYKWIDFYSTQLPSKPFLLETNVLKANLSYYFHSITQILCGKFAQSYSIYALLFIIALGIVIHFKKHGYVWIIFLLSYLTTIGFFRLRDERLLLPILPFLYYFLLKGLTIFLKNKKQLLIIVISLCVLSIYTMQGTIWFFTKAVFDKHLYNTNDLITYQWLITHTQPNDIMLSGIPVRLYLFTKRKGFSFAKITERHLVLSFIYSNNIRYIYVAPMSPTTDFNQAGVFELSDYYTMLREDNKRFRNVFFNPQLNSYVFEVIPQKEEFFKALTKLNQAKVFNQQQNYKKEIAELQEALKLQPDFYLALNMLGIAFIENGNINKGLSIIEKSTKLYPSIERGYVALAYAYIKQGDKKKAISILEYAYQLAISQHHDLLSTAIQQELKKIQ